MAIRRRNNILTAALLLVSAAIAVYFIFIQTWPASYKAPPVISVQAFYPGASAQTVVDTVAAPIEEQVDGVMDMLSMSSQSANDGSYTLHVTFKVGTDLDMALVLVQNRVSLAMPVIPALVQQEGISVRKKSPEPLVLVSLTSPDNRHDDRYLSNYATIYIKDELARSPGIGDIVLFGQRDYRMQIVLDADKLAALQLTALDVVTAINQQNVQVAGGQIGQAPVWKGQQLPLTINTQGRLVEPEQFENVIVKGDRDGRTIRLRDVARVESARNEGSHASFNSNPALLLSIHPLSNIQPSHGARAVLDRLAELRGFQPLSNHKPSGVSRAVLDKLAELRAHLPEGLALEVAFDFAPNLEKPNNFTTPEHLVIDAELPEGVSAERTARNLEEAAELLRKTPGVQDVLALTEHPFSLARNRPCLVVGLTPKDQRKLSREQIAGNVRVALQNQIHEAEFRLSIPSTAAGFPVYGFPIEFAIEDHGDHGSAILRECTRELVEKMSQSGKFSDVGVGSGLCRVPVLNMEIDRTRCQALGVEVDEIFNTIQACLGPYHVHHFNLIGRALQASLQVDPRFRDRATDILKLLVKNKQNQLVRLGTVMAVSDAIVPMVIERHNRYPIARITANLAEGVPLAKAKSLCETLAEQEFGTKQFQLVWRAQ
jgi:multidrug efflux pump subunit AcrB